ncbi:hypothetical protein L9F63_008302, partial [Diploptera punctata]
MTYRFPPQSPKQEMLQYTSVMNFNIPPPGFRQPYANEEDNRGTYMNYAPPQHQILEESMKHLRESEENRNIAIYLQNFVQAKERHVNISKKHTTHSLKISEARQLLKICLNDLEKLQTLQKDLNKNCEGLSPALWKEKWEHVKKLKVTVSNSLERLNNPGTVDHLKKLLMKQTKKRKREKRKRSERQEMLADCHVKRQRLDKTIDNWLKDMQDVVERAKREESLKHEADQVLSEVTRKKAEARRQLNMLKGLEKLRRIRAQVAVNRGQHVNTETGIRFTRVIEHLVKLWEDQMKEYEVEEQGLRVMLEEAVEERTKSEVTQTKQVLNQWEMLLFGKREPFNDFYQAAENDVEAFIEIRKSWDKFVAHPGALVSSSIPIGWVLPKTEKPQNWIFFLNNVFRTM